MSALLVLRVELEETVKMRKQTTGLARKFPLVFCTVLWANPDLPGALAVGDLPASAGGTGSIPDQERVHVPRGSQAHEM